MKRIHKLIRLLLPVLLLAGGVPVCLAQLPQLEGIGLSGNISTLDTTLVQGDSLYVLASYTSGPEWHVSGVGIDAEFTDQVRLFLYPDPVPNGEPTGSMLVPVDRNAVVIDTISEPHTVRFGISLLPVTFPHIRSVQLAMAVYALDSTGSPVLSDLRTSFLQVGTVAPLNNSVDEQHATYLEFSGLPQVQGIGLSGSATVLDTIVIEGDWLYVAASYLNSPEFTPVGVGLSADSMQTLRIYLHPDSTPARTPIGQVLATVDPLAVVFDTTVTPHVVRFRVRLEGVINPYVHSIQLAMAIYSTDSIGGPLMGEVRTSYSPVDWIRAAHNRVDGLHASSLRFQDTRTYPPRITYPQDGAILGRYFHVNWIQPEDADTNAIYLTLTNLDPHAPEQPHTLYLINWHADSNKSVPLDGLNLFNHDVVDTLFGSPSLIHMGLYNFMVSYQDIWRNPVMRDTVIAIRMDLRTETPTLYEPRLGSQATDSSVRIVYNLPEVPDSVWLTFTASNDSGEVYDSASPHILRLNPNLYHDEGMTTILLDGRTIGTADPQVAESNRGVDDHLVSQAIYSVTVSYGDRLGNDNASMTNTGYIWPDDHTTIPPRLISPPPPPPSQPTAQIAVSHIMHVEFLLPEPPMQGSVYLQLATSGPDPGSPHRVYIRTAAPGYLSFDLDVTNFGSAQLVDSVTGSGNPQQNNTLVDSLRYAVRVYYQDSLGNPSSPSPLASVIFDNHTRPVQILQPRDGDTLSHINEAVQFVQPEKSFPGSLRIVLTRTGGEMDVGSPHTLYLTNDSAATKLILLQPASLIATQGVSRVEGGSALLARSVYQLSIQYSDTLDNPVARSDVNSLLYPSGAAVFASGNPMGSGGITPGQSRDVVFRLSLHALNGSSVLRRLRFSVTGSISPQDLDATQTRLYSSVDTVLSETGDPMVDSLGSWLGGEMVFDSFAVAIPETETNFFVTLSYLPSADPAHEVHLSLAGPASVDCGGDPVIAVHWPIGGEDIPLDVQLTSFTTAQDTLFGALQVIWTVASERDNVGFVVLRKAQNVDSFSVAGTWRDHPELVGRGTEPTPARYAFVDRGLTPGRAYTYRLAAESINFDRVEFEAETQGTPRIPPSTFTIGDAYPNPFNQNVTFNYVVPVTADVQIIIYDLMGREVRRLVTGHLAPAEYRAMWDSRDSQGVLMPSGIYWVRMKAGTDYLKAKKLMLIK